MGSALANAWERGTPWPAGWDVRFVAETGSTNDDLGARAAELPDGTVLAAGHQTAGRGRLDRRWEAPAGANLLASILLRRPPSDPGELVRRVSLAAVDACRGVAGVEARLKWPNDVIVGDRKLAGVLAERHASDVVVVGIGLNVGWAPDGAARLGDDVDPADVLAALLAAFDELPADVGPAYRAALDTLGRGVRVERDDGDLVGTATDIEPDGRLVVVDGEGSTRHVSVGDVVHLWPRSRGEPP